MFGFGRQKKLSPREQVALDHSLHLLGMDNRSALFNIHRDKKLTGGKDLCVVGVADSLDGDCKTGFCLVIDNGSCVDGQELFPAVSSSATLVQMAKMHGVPLIIAMRQAHNGALEKAESHLVGNLLQKHAETCREEIAAAVDRFQRRMDTEADALSSIRRAYAAYSCAAIEMYTDGELTKDEFVDALSPHSTARM